MFKNKECCTHDKHAPLKKLTQQRKILNMVICNTELLILQSQLQKNENNNVLTNSKMYRPEKIAQQSMHFSLNNKTLELVLTMHLKK